MPSTFDGFRAWSHSSIELFDQCHRKWENNNLSKEFKEPWNPDGPLAQGQVIHEAFADYMTGKTERLPVNLGHHSPFLDYLVDSAEELLVESELALDRDMQPCGWRDWNDVFVRAKVDYTGITGKEALVVDHKTGKYKDDTTQIEMQMAVVSACRPDLEKFTGLYYWTNDRKRREPFTRTKEQLTEVWTPLLRRVRSMQAVINSGEFKPMPNFTCNKYCPVKSCGYHGKKN